MKETEYLSWLKTLKVGDEVGFQEKFGKKEVIISSIKKITPTGMFRLEYENLLFHTNGYQYYGGKVCGIRLLPKDILIKVKNEQEKRNATEQTLRLVYDRLLNKIENATLDELNELHDKLYSLL